MCTTDPPLASAFSFEFAAGHADPAASASGTHGTVASARAAFTSALLQELNEAPSCLSTCNETTATCLSPQASGRAAWLGDGDVSACCEPACKEPFSLLQRRHHCRFCGKFFCIGCSQKAVQGLRACRPCFDRCERTGRERCTVLHRSHGASGIFT